MFSICQYIFCLISLCLIVFDIALKYFNILIAWRYMAWHKHFSNKQTNKQMADWLFRISYYIVSILLETGIFNDDKRARKIAWISLAFLSLQTYCIHFQDQFIVRFQKNVIYRKQEGLKHRDQSFLVFW